MDKSDFSKGSIIKHMVRLAIPMIIAQMVNVLYSVVDRVFIGRIGGSTLPLTGAGVAFPICTFAIAFANLIGMGGAPLFSIKRGEGDDEEASYIMNNSLVMLTIIGVVFSVVVFIIRRPLLYALGADDATYVYANSYISIYLIGSVFVTISLGLNTFINAQGFSKIGMMTVTIGAVLNTILDPIFIFALNLGVEGAALATVIAQFFSALWTLKFLFGKDAVIKINPKHFKLKAKRILEIMALGLASFTMQITNSIVTIVCNKNLGLYGGHLYIAAMTIISSIREVVMMPIQGFYESAKPIISYNYGAKEMVRVKKTIKYLGVGLCTMTCAAWLIVNVLARPLFMIFTSDEALISIGIHSMNIYYFGFFMMTFQFVGQTTFTALGKAKQAVFFSLLRKVFIVVPLTILLPMMFSLGCDGVFLAEPISNFIGGLACFITMMMTVYKKL